MVGIVKKFKSFFNPTEDEIDFDSFIKFPLFLFKIVAFDIEPMETNAKEKQSRQVRKFYFIFYYSAICLGIFQATVYGFVHSDEIFVALNQIPNVLTLVLVVIKTSTTIFRKNDIWNLIEELRNIFKLHGSDTERSGIKLYLDKYNRIVKGLTGFFSIVTVALFLPFIDYLVFGTMEFTVSFWFPFDAFQLSTYPIAFVYSNWMCVNSSIFELSVDILLFALITVISMEFDLLRTDLINLKSASKHHRKYVMTSLLERHKKLLELGEKLSPIYAPSVFSNFAISSIVMCFNAFQISNSKSSGAVYAFYIPCSITFMGQVLLLCIFGQKLIDSSLQIASGIYECDWVDLEDIALKKQIILIMMRAQQPVQMTAMKVVKVSIENFTTVS